MRVLVTGANGHVGFALVKHLVERGYTVRASVRDKADPARTTRLDSLGVEIVEADLLRPDTLTNAVTGMDAVFQVAATYELIPRKGAESVIRDSVEGGVNVLRAARAAGVRRVVLTSSCVAVGPRAPGTPVCDESAWNDHLEVPYYRAKTEGERRAWAYAKESGLDLVCVLPGGVGGPYFARATPTIDLLANALKGAFRLGVPRGNFVYVDVRDVAEAHRLALETARASGRYIITNDHSPTFIEIIEAIRRADPAAPRPGPLMPDWMLGAVPFFDWLNHKLKGTARLVSPEVVASMRGLVWNVTNARARRELGWTPRVPFEQSVRDTIDAIAGYRQAA
jgi:dihydroflavonol-4-reductase